MKKKNLEICPELDEEGKDIVNDMKTSIFQKEGLTISIEESDNS
jgi:hypothetical protein